MISPSCDCGSAPTNETLCFLIGSGIRPLDGYCPRLHEGKDPSSSDYLRTLISARSQRKSRKNYDSLPMSRVAAPAAEMPGGRRQRTLLLGCALLAGFKLWLVAGDELVARANPLDQLRYLEMARDADPRSVARGVRPPDPDSRARLSRMGRPGSSGGALASPGDRGPAGRGGASLLHGAAPGGDIAGRGPGVLRRHRARAPQPGRQPGRPPGGLLPPRAAVRPRRVGVERPGDASAPDAGPRGLVGPRAGSAVGHSAREAAATGGRRGDRVVRPRRGPLAGRFLAFRASARRRPRERAAVRDRDRRGRRRRDQSAALRRLRDDRRHGSRVPGCESRLALHRAQRAETLRARAPGRARSRLPRERGLSRASPDARGTQLGPGSELQYRRRMRRHRRRVLSLAAARRRRGRRAHGVPRRGGRLLPAHRRRPGSRVSKRGVALPPGADELPASVSGDLPLRTSGVRCAA